MIEVLKIIAESWPIALIVIAVTAGIVVNRRIKQAQDNSAAIYNLNVQRREVARHSDDAG